MEKFKSQSDLSQPDVIEKFKELYDAEMVEITYEDLPQSIKAHFEARSKQLILPETYTEGNFSKLYKCTHRDGDITYAGQQDKFYDTEGSAERLTYFADTRDGQITGYLELRLPIDSLSGLFTGKPFVGFTRTHSAFLKQGLGKRRLEEANAYSLSEHGLPLNSDSLIADEAVSLWKSLISDGKAEQYEANGKERYRFITK